MEKLHIEEWDGKDLKGPWLFTLKRDGILLVRQEDGTITTKNGKPVYNLPDDVMDPGFQFAECFCGSWGETWSIISASKSKRRKVKLEEIYPIYPKYGNGLDMSVLPDPSATLIRHFLKTVNKAGHEGLVLNQGDRYIKVKPVQTVDVKILGMNASDAKSHKGALREFVTEKGKVGIGISRADRYKFMDPKYIGCIIEVEVTGGYTKTGKFRHASFVRMRPDK